MLTIDTTGAHPTTEASIEALQWLQAQSHEFHNILDMGCGNGILSVIAASIWEVQILAVDISPNAIKDTKTNIAEHGLADHIAVLRNDGFQHRTIAAEAPYDLIIFNLIAESLIKMAPDVKRLLADNGYCILSGMLTWLAPQTEETYLTLGFELVERIDKSPWRSWIVRKPVQSEK